ncbi:hypothetical protein FA95DRAFT_610528 [Auriscalpium vulgare]|uniref:Uncharacterized protein n=1 Tax=Auriscalpium vulgare TaxID=40419 RepID=A0ACB8RDT7_9AGAM|nr:hypothetical protein FA95DRAFT_610528 [Auriscalpium vulgare]
MGLDAAYARSCPKSCARWGGSAAIVGQGVARAPLFPRLWHFPIDADNGDLSDYSTKHTALSSESSAVNWTTTPYPLPHIMATGALPLDIHNTVMGSVYTILQHAGIDYPTLLACALVCRAWRGIAQSLLLRRVPYLTGGPYTTKTDPSYPFTLPHPPHERAPCCTCTRHPPSRLGEHPGHRLHFSA